MSEKSIEQQLRDIEKLQGDALHKMYAKRAGRTVELDIRDFRHPRIIKHAFMDPVDTQPNSPLLQVGGHRPNAPGSKEGMEEELDEKGAGSEKKEDMAHEEQGKELL
ncbi:HBL009Wp [Eremothecium sinecaudum]|uniref:HBL009Wp n=1 Tax=Eremothecium sinecaudum TaxID=45286 RepID=A0A109UWQ8_9SACH|nr:HBL009Wp [Eremothecium sinecaudum]AMD18893.1 HBL009Wp [Eremothecium sinecaudum]